MSLSAFFAQNAKQPENKKVVVSDRFCNETGTPIPWELRALPEREDNTIRSDCTVTSTFKGRTTTRVDSTRYSAKLIAASVAFPDLTDAELQKSYGTTSAVDLLQAMLFTGEYSTLAQAVNEINQFTSDKEEEAKDEVKNS